MFRVGARLTASLRAMVSRSWHAIVAALVVVAIVLQIHQALGVASLPPEQSTGLLRGTDATGRIIRVLSFFTIQSNILVGVAAALVALDPSRDGRGFRVLRLMSLVGITVTAIVYTAILAPTHDPIGFEQTLINALVHYVVPAAAVLGWLILGPRPRIDRRTVGLTLLWPAAWLAYTLVRGALWHWYPYPFVDVEEHGYGVVAANAVGVLLVLLAVAGAFAWLDRRVRPAP